MPKYKVNDRVWFAKCRWERISITCPTCYGKKEVTLILGNGEHVLLPCQGCALGYNAPTGVVEEHDYIVEPELVTITGMSIEIDNGLEVVRYRSYGYCYDETDLYTDEEAARQKALAHKQQLEEEQRTLSKYLKEKAQKSFSWNASYHMRTAAKLRKDAMRHEEKAKLCKERSREE